MSRKIKCIKCGAECCTCTGCNPDAYKNGLCPKCQQEVNDSKSSNTAVQQLSVSQGLTTTDRL